MEQIMVQVSEKIVVIDTHLLVKVLKIFHSNIHELKPYNHREVKQICGHVTTIEDYVKKEQWLVAKMKYPNNIRYATILQVCTRKNACCISTI
jgi:hypothetical protein